MRSNKINLEKVIYDIISLQPDSGTDVRWIDKWEFGRYAPSPTIIEAAIDLYNNHQVEEIEKCEADEIERLETTEYILDIIKKSKENKTKSICFVTGVPGAGKTLVGLDIAVNHQADKAVFLSGNGPLVDVLTTALARDRYERKHAQDKKYTKSQAITEVKPFIQLIHHYRKNAIEKIEGIENSKIVVSKEHDRAIDEVEHIAIFDEAQRAWNKKQLCKPDRYSRKSNWLKEGIFPYSEPGFLIWSMNLKPDWAVIICLVGGGQEINTGEAGILEWIQSIERSFPEWHIYISDSLHEQEYAGKQLYNILSKLPNVTTNRSLHLSASRRSFRAEKLSEFIAKILTRDKENAQKLYKEIRTNYPLYLTRDLEKAKIKIRQMRKANQRGGLLISSQAARLRSLGLDIKKVTTYDKVASWFLGGRENVESSDFMEVALGEFFVQGLELDWTAVIWDADFRYKDDSWGIYHFNGKDKWNNVNNVADRAYQLNGYRVILTRARLGMVIVVPKGDPDDPTRRPEFYDPTYLYLKEIGIMEL